MPSDCKQPTVQELSLLNPEAAPASDGLCQEDNTNGAGDVHGRRAVQYEHETLLRAFRSSWLAPGPRSEEDFSVSFAAYHALAHAGLLLRMRQAGPHLLLAGLSTVECAKLVSDACDFAIGFRIPARLTRILANEIPEPEDLEEFEHILLQRDELDVVIELSKRVVADAAKTDDALLAKLADAISVAAEFDDAFLKRPDLMAICSRILVALRPLNWLANGSYPDWFAQARSRDVEPKIEDVIAGREVSSLHAQE